MSRLLRKHHLISFLFFFIILILSFVIVAGNKQQKTYRSKAEEIISPTPEASPSARIALLESEITTINEEIIKALDQYEQGDEVKKQETLPVLVKNGEEKQQKQIELLQLNPLSVYQKALSKNITARLPKEVPHEEYIDQIQGKVNTTIYDNFDNNTSYTTATFLPAQAGIPDNVQEEEINFYPTDNQTFLSGTKVTLNNAIRIDEDSKVLGVSSVYAQEQEQPPQPSQEQTTPQSHLIAVEIETIEAPPLDTLGEQKVLVLLAKTSNIKESELPTFQKLNEIINGDINEFLKKNSYGQASIKAQIVEKWYKAFEANFFAQMVNDGVNFQEYDNQRLLTIIITHDPNHEDISGASTTGKAQLNLKKTDDKYVINASHATIWMRNNKSLFDQKFINIDGELSLLEIIISHELGHSFGLTEVAGYTGVDCLDRTLHVAPDKAGFMQFGNSVCSWLPYRNPFDVMGIGRNGNWTDLYGYHYNIYSKSRLGWVQPGLNGKLLKINIADPDGEYTIQQIGGNGLTGVWLPFETDTKDQSKVDYFLEYRGRLITDQPEGMAINLLSGEFQHGAKIQPFLFPSTDKNGNLKEAYATDDIFTDLINNIQILVKNIDSEKKNLTFIIRSCDKDNFNLLPSRAGNQSISSLNIFENDLRGENNTTKPLTIREDFIIENTSACFNKKYIIDPLTTVINQGNLSLSPPQFSLLSTEEVPPSQGIDNAFTAIATINNPHLQDSQMTFTVEEQNVDKDKDPQKDKERISQTLTYQFHVVLSTDEYKNDLEPFMIEIKDKNTNNKEFNHLEVNKEQTLVFTSNIANNSRRIENENPSPKFRMIWYIQNEKGNNVIPPFNQPHAGIPPKTIDNANPAILTWIIPKDLPIGDYKVLLEVDPNDNVKNEFNENNNMIWRYFSVVE